MTVENYVEQILCVPVTRIGFKYIVEAIEIVLDTKDIKFYKQLSEIHGVGARYLEKAIRDAKTIGVATMEKSLQEKVFNCFNPTNGEFIIKAANEYRRTYEDKRT